MIVAPETEIYLLKCPLEEDQQNQLDFVNETAQVNYFQSLPKLALMNCTYQRENNTMWVKFNIEAIRNYNYVMYKNNQYGNKWFYAFITGMDYENNVVTGVHIRTDVFQTYLFEYQWKRSYVKRETVSDDTFGKHLIPEDIDTGDFIVNHSKTEFIEIASTKYIQTPNDYTPIIAVQCSERIGKLYENGSQGASEVDDTYIVGSMPQGCYYYFFDNLPTGESSAGYDGLKKVRNHLDSIGKGQAILNMFIVPRKSIYQITGRYLKLFDENGNISSTGVQVYEPSANTYGAVNIQSVTYPRPTTISGYTPKNNKMFTKQFNYFMVTNYAGGAMAFNWEDFRDIVTGNVNTPNFRVNGVVSLISSFSIQPMNSAKSEVDNLGNKISSEFLSGASLPTLSWDSDYYLNWIAQNGKKFELQKQQQIVDVVGDTIGNTITTSLTTSNPILGALTGGATLMNGLNDYENLEDNIKEAQREADIIPNTVSGNLNAGDMAFALNSVGFAFINYQIRQNYAIKADRYLDMFGYRVNEIKTPNTKTRKYWNYLMTVNANIQGDIPQTAIDELKAIFNKGITIWHDSTHFLDYSLTNSIL